MSVFTKRTAFKPFEYPEAVEFKNAVSHSYWLVSEWNFMSDLDDFKVRLTPEECSAVKNAMLAISQIEVSVKKFWGRLGDRLPKPEFDQVGAVFAESEIRHADAYSHLLEILGLNADFEALLKVPAIKGRVKYLTDALRPGETDEDFAATLALFSLFVENVSLFGQFAVVKSINKHRNLLKDIDNVITATQQEECYAEGTEVLTPGGWVDFRDIGVGDPVSQYEHGILSFVPVSHKTERDYEGEMYHFSNSRADCLVTPGHEMVSYTLAGDMRKTRADAFRPHSRMSVPAGGKLSGGGVDALTADERLRVAIQADGSTLRWVTKAGESRLRGESGGATHVFGLTKQRKKLRLEAILKDAGVMYKKRDDGAVTEYRLHYNHDVDCKQFDWVDFAGRSAAWCRDFVMETVEWDGFRPGPQSWGYSSTNKEAVDVVQAAAVLAGMSTGVSVRVDPRKESYKPCYRLRFSDRELLPRGHGYSREIVQYSGKVYCVTVPSGVLITRRNGKVMVAGNCVHALFGAYLVNLIRKERPEWFDESFYERLEKSCRKAYKHESAIVDWIYEAGELPYLSADDLKEFIKSRMNASLEMVGGKAIFRTSEERLESTRWLTEELMTEAKTDFFHKRPTTYSKFATPVTAEELF